MTFTIQTDVNNILSSIFVICIIKMSLVPTWMIKLFVLSSTGKGIT